MDLKTAETTGCNCNCSLGVLRGTSTHIGASLIIECVIIGVLLILIGCVVYLFYWGSKLAKLVKALDPVGTYKRVRTTEEDAMEAITKIDNVLY
ncbi:hypothetical protein HUJ04_006636 [Dendroctonus ponderosae]|nr:hypothetical protein HUJ04_006636 [Dendroctonus ponderosae]